MWGIERINSQGGNCRCLMFVHRGSCVSAVHRSGCVLCGNGRSPAADTRVWANYW